MVEADQVVQLILTKRTYERLTQIATMEKKRPEDLMILYVDEGLDSHSKVSQILEDISQQYRHRLSQEGKLNQPSELVMQELLNIREQIANELYS